MKKNFLLSKTTILAASAVILLGLSAVGSTRAAIIADTNDKIKANFRTSNVSVSLLENGKNVEDGTLLSGITDFHIGETYNEKVSFANGEDYDAYARVIITRSWYNETGKDTTLNPEWIELDIVNAEGDEAVWIEDKAASTSERTVYYYKKPIAAGDSVDIISSLKVNNDITKIVTESGLTGTIQTPYDGKSFSIDVRVDEIQTHNAYDAARASWGVYLDIDENGIIQKVTHEMEGQTNED